MISTILTPAAVKTLDIWHEMFHSKDKIALPSLFDKEVVFRSPMAHTSYPGVDTAVLLLSNVIEVFENFTYYREFATDDGLSVVLEFSAEVKGRQLKGIDMIQFNDEGKIVAFEVMIRPMSGLQMLGAEMAKRVAPYLGKQKSKSE